MRMAPSNSKLPQYWRPRQDIEPDIPETLDCPNCWTTPCRCVEIAIHRTDLRREINDQIRRFRVTVRLRELVRGIVG